jgi:hypothetical protein
MQVTNKAPAAAAAAGAALSDWTLADMTSADWTKNDPDTTMSSLTHVSGVNKCTLSVTGNPNLIDGCTWYQEVKTEDGSSFSFADRPCTVEFAITMPAVGWSINSGATTGGLNRPAVASRVYCVAGVMTDPENLPATAGATAWPLDMMATGLSTHTSNHKNRRVSVYNANNTSPRGAISSVGQDLPTISNAEYLAGRKSYNRITWWGRIRKHDGLTATGISNAEDPLCKDMLWTYRDDVGDSKAGVLTHVTQQRFRVHNDRLYVFVSVGRSAAAGSTADLDFTVHYRITQLDGGTCPSGRTGL